MRAFSKPWRSGDGSTRGLGASTSRYRGVWHRAAGPIGSRKNRHVDVVELRLDVLEEEDEIENEEVIGVGRHGGVE